MASIVGMTSTWLALTATEREVHSLKVTAGRLEYTDCLKDCYRQHVNLQLCGLTVARFVQLRDSTGIYHTDAVAYTHVPTQGH